MTEREELMKRLRKADEYEPLGHDGWEAAERIVELEAEARTLRNYGATADARIAELEAALKKIASDPIPISWSAQYIARAALEGKAND